MEKKIEFTVYHITDQDGIPIYVGITSNPTQRFYYHGLGVRTPDKQVKNKKGEIKYPHRTYLYNKLRKIISENSGYKLEEHIEIIEKCDSFEELLQAEVRLIKMYRNQGTKLCNLTDGGQGALGHKPIFTTEWKSALSKAKQLYFENGGKNNFAGKKHTEETKKKIIKTRRDNIKAGIVKPINYDRIGKTNEELYGKEKADRIAAQISAGNKGRLLGYKKSWEEKRIAAVRKALCGKSKFTHKIITPDGNIIIWNKSLNEFGASINQSGDKFYAAALRDTKTRDGYFVKRLN